MPLVWAHAEYLKLCRSLADGKVFDTPAQTTQRYIMQATTCPYSSWKFNLMRRSIPQGKVLRLEVLDEATVRWTSDDWTTFVDTDTRDTGLDIHVADLATNRLPTGSRVVFTFRWMQGGRWEGTNFEVMVGDQRE